MQNAKKKPVAVVIGATSKWQSDGRNTHLIHGQSLSDTEVPVAARWGIGGALAQKFAREGFFVVMTTRSAANAQALEAAILEQGGDCMITELNLISEASISNAFASIRAEAGEPEVLSTMPDIWKAATCRQKWNFWNISRWRCSIRRITSLAEGHS